MTQQYERTKVIEAPADEVFAWVTEIGNLPRYLPPSRRRTGRMEPVIGYG